MKKLINKKDTKGNLLSPILPENIKNYLIDIAGTITEDIPNLIQMPWKQLINGMKKDIKFVSSHPGWKNIEKLLKYG